METLRLKVLVTCRAFGRTAKQVTRKIARDLKATRWLFSEYRRQEEYMLQWEPSDIATYTELNGWVLEE